MHKKHLLVLTLSLMLKSAVAMEQPEPTSPREHPTQTSPRELPNRTPSYDLTELRRALGQPKTIFDLAGQMPRGTNPQDEQAKLEAFLNYLWKTREVFTNIPQAAALYCEGLVRTTTIGNDFLERMAEEDARHEAYDRVHTRLDQMDEYANSGADEYQEAEENLDQIVESAPSNHRAGDEEIEELVQSSTDTVTLILFSSLQTLDKDEQNRLYKTIRQRAQRYKKQHAQELYHSDWYE